MRTKPYLLCWTLLAALMGCGENEPEPDPVPAPEPSEEAAEPEAAPEAAPGADSAGPRAEADSYVLEARPEEGGYEAGSLGQFAIRLSGRGGWHLNQDFPFSVELEGPATVTFPKATLEKGDAAEFTDDAARVDVPFTPAAAGEHEVRARVSFAVCSPTSCVPKTATVALNLRVD